MMDMPGRFEYYADWGFEGDKVYLLTSRIF